MTSLISLFIFGNIALPCVFQTAEEECGTALTNEMDEEPYFVDFLRDAPEPTGELLQSKPRKNGPFLNFYILGCSNV